MKCGGVGVGGVVLSQAENQIATVTSFPSCRSYSKQLQAVEEVVQAALR